MALTLNQTRTLARMLSVMKRRHTALGAAMAAVLTLGLTGGVAPPAAGASRHFENGESILVSAEGPAVPSRSTIVVDSIGGRITDVNVVLLGVSSTNLEGIDIALQGPGGGAAPIMSDACGSADVSGIVLRFDEDNPANAIPDHGPCATGAYRTHDYDPGGGDPDPNTGFLSLNDFDGKNPVGRWALHVTQDENAGITNIASGWRLEIEYIPAEVRLPHDSDTGTAAPYPWRKAVARGPSTVREVRVGLMGVQHKYAPDLDVLLVGPRGQKVMLMSDVCGSAFVEADFLFDDDAPGPVPAGDCSGSIAARPTNASIEHGPGDPTADTFPGGPPGPYPTRPLSVFDGTNPNGTWRILVTDDRPATDGGFIEKVRLYLDLRPDTKITQRPKKKTTKRRAHFEYRTILGPNVRRQCKLDQRPWRPCAAGGITYKNLRPGRHVFRVRGLIAKPGAAVVADLTPAKYVWRVKR